MTLVGEAHNLGEKMKIYPQVLIDVLCKTSNLALSCFSFVDDGKEMEKSKKTHV